MNIKLPRFVRIEISSQRTKSSKNRYQSLLFFALLFFAASSAFSQGGTCSDIEPFCAGQDGLIFPNCYPSGSGCVASAETGPEYACLGTQPYPAWFYLQIEQGGDLDFEIVQNTQFDANGNPIGAELDVDFIAWGPFAPGDDLCDYSQLQPFNEVGCSYSAAPVENFSLLNAQNGEIYVLLITNYSEDQGFISLGQIGGNGTTNCDIVLLCDVTIDGGDQTYCGVDEVTLTTSTTGPLETYAWYMDNVLIPGETSETLTVSETADYKVIIDGTDCDVPAEDEVTITFMSSPCATATCTTIDFEDNFGTGTERVCLDPNVSSSTYICNDTTQIEDGQYCIYHTSNTLNTGWHPDMEDHTDGDVNGRMLFVNAAFEPGEFYRRTITLTPNENFALNAWITTVYDTDSGICGGNSIPSNVIFRIEDTSGTLIAETNTGDIPNGSEPNWQEFTIAFNTGANTDIQLVLINNSIGGCGNDLAIDDITLTKEGNPPVVVAPPDLTECPPSGGSTAFFDLTAQIPIILDGQDPTDFNVSFHLNQGAAELNINPIVTPTAYENTSNPQSIYVRVEKVTEPDCFNTTDFDLIISSEVVLTTNLPASTEQCSTDPFITLDATPTNTGIDLSLVTYLWMDSNSNTVSTTATYTPTFADTFTVQVIYDLTCSDDTFTIEVIVYDPAILDLGPDETLLCDGTPFEIVPTITGSTGSISYLWSPGGETTPTITVGASGTYSLQITTNNLCESTDEIVLTFADLPAIDLGDDLESCFDAAEILDATPSNYDPTLATYVWSLDGTVLASETSATINASSYGYGVYTVTVTVGACSSEDNVTIVPRSDLVVLLGDDFNSCPTEVQTLSATTEETGITYQWYLNGTSLNLDTSSIEVVLGQDVTSTQFYSVVITRGQCTGTDEIEVSPYEIDNCTITQGITPNNDGYNDSLDLTFLQDRTGIENIQIFNRYGTKVFEKSNYVNEWFGQEDDGDELPTGTYFYVINFSGSDTVYGEQATGWVYINRETK